MNTTHRNITNTTSALRHGWHPVALGTEIQDEPVPVRLLGEPWVVARLDDRLVAFADRCPYRLGPPPAGQDEKSGMVCRYHGWRFVASGECTAFPAVSPRPDPGDSPTSASGAAHPRGARATPPFGITERHGIVWIAPEEPFADIIDLPECGDPSFDNAWLPVTRTSTCASVLAGNFLSLEIARTPFAYTHTHNPTHGATTGPGQNTAVPPHRVEADGYGFRAAVEHGVANPTDPGVAAGIRPLVQRWSSHFAFRPPFMLRLRIDYPDAGTTYTILFCLQPEDDDMTRVYTRIYTRAPFRDGRCGGAERLAAAMRFEQVLLGEDFALRALREKSTAAGLPRGRSVGSTDGEPADYDPLGTHDSHVGDARAALCRMLAAFTDRAERGCTQASRRAGTTRPRYARRPSVTTGR